jgi:protein transport protein SEC31
LNTQGEANGAGLFSIFSGSLSEATSPITSGFSLNEAPKWLKRPICAARGLGWRLVCVGNLPRAAGQGQSQTVHVHKAVSLKGGVVERAKQLVEADRAKALQSFAESKANEDGEDKAQMWKTLASSWQ